MPLAAAGGPRLVATTIAPVCHIADARRVSAIGCPPGSTAPLGVDTPLPVKLVDEHAFEPGSTLPVDPAPEKLHVFDVETGARI